MKTPNKQNKLIKAETVIDLREKGRLDIGVMPRPVLRCGIPLQKPPKDYLEHISWDGNCTLSLTAHPRHGMPFGRDLLMPLWLYSEAYAQKSRTIRFDSGRSILRAMGLREDGDSFQWLTGSMNRNFYATWTHIIEQEVGTRVRQLPYIFHLVESAELWLTRDKRQLSFTAGGYENSITLTHPAYEFAMHRGYQAKVELNVVSALSASPGACRLFMILRDRCAMIPSHKPHGWIPISGTHGLDSQMGVKPYENQKLWRQTLRRWLADIRRHWPECPDGKMIQQGAVDEFWRLQIPRCLPISEHPAKPS